MKCMLPRINYIVDVLLLFFLKQIFITYVLASKYCFGGFILKLYACSTTKHFFSLLLPLCFGFSCSFQHYIPLISNTACYILIKCAHKATVIKYSTPHLILIIFPSNHFRKHTYMHAVFT